MFLAVAHNSLKTALKLHTNTGMQGRMLNSVMIHSHSHEAEDDWEMNCSSSGGEEPQRTVSQTYQFQSVPVFQCLHKGFGPT